jgi:hypothetical protein
VYAQASVLGLYDPDRSQALSLEGEIRSWGAFLGAIQQAITQQKAKRGAGLRILTETVTSPTLANQIKEMLAAFPAAKWHQWEPAGAHSSGGGSAPGVWAAGQHGLRFERRGRDCFAGRRFPFLGAGQPAIRAAVFRAAAGARRADRNEPAVRGRADAHPTGTKADHRLPLRAADVEQFAWSLAAALGADTGGRKGASTAADKWIVPVARDLQKHKGASLVIAGEQQSPAVHALAHAMNAALGNVGKTVLYTDPVEANPVDQVASLYDLVKDLDAGAVDLLLILGGNPAYNAPVELGFRDRLKKAASARPPEPARGRNQRALPLALAHDALPGDVERLPGARWHHDHHAAVDRAALRG